LSTAGAAQEQHKVVVTFIEPASKDEGTARADEELAKSRAALAFIGAFRPNPRKT
jgi:hypothetical protein